MNGPDASSGENYDKQSVAHNTVLIRMPGETMKGLTHPLDLQANSGGQRKLPTFARLLAFQSDRLFAYAATERDTHLPPGQVRPDGPPVPVPDAGPFRGLRSRDRQKRGLSKTWLLHTANEPVITGSRVPADQEQGRIFCRTLYRGGCRCWKR